MGKERKAVTHDWEKINREINESLGWRYGTRDDIAPDYPDNLTCWWFEGAPYSADELPDCREPSASIELLKRIVGSNFERSVEIFSDSIAVAQYDDPRSYEEASITRFAFPLEEAIPLAYHATLKQENT
jgi:hypothetical protein